MAEMRVASKDAQRVVCWVELMVGMKVDLTVGMLVDAMVGPLVAKWVVKTAVWSVELMVVLTVG